VGLYPTVVLLSLATLPLHLPLWLALLIGNLFSSFVMTFVTMPYYVNPMLKHWLRPPPNVSAAKANWRGLTISVVSLALWSVVFYVLTKVILNLPY
jgi:antibiotic biosynthesis monooxygenase (ABM) superfamily enzyme